jgi:signal transduction histidine kinase
MQPDEAIALLRSNEAEDRLRAARALSRTARRRDANAIADALAREDDRWIRRFLARALGYAQDRRRGPRQTAGLVSDDERIDELLGVATASVTALLLHEFNPLLGDIRRHAEREVGSSVRDYAESRTRQAVERLDRLLDAIANLNKAASPSALMEFDLAALANHLVEACAERSGMRIEAAGPNPLLVHGDERLVEMAMDQGLRNAIEATAESGSPDPVTVTWTSGDNYATVSVGDRGLGLPKGFDRALRAISTTKDKRLHHGLGLLTANRAARSMGGSIVVSPRLGGGVSFVLSWPARGPEDANPPR